MNALLNPGFALIGLWEMAAILAVLLTLAAVAVAVIALILVLAARNRVKPQTSLPASAAAGSESAGTDPLHSGMK